MRSGCNQIPGQYFWMEQYGTADPLFLHPNTFCRCSHHLPFHHQMGYELRVKVFQILGHHLVSRQNHLKAQMLHPVTSSAHIHSHPDLLTLKTEISPPQTN